ncbi:MAG: hypothetical protein JNK37_17090 [Verrucomicrobiales bacterium]|nr:hypothetical protein [Verrucomicrobiales bacterium]
MAIDRQKISADLRQLEIDYDVASLRAEGKAIWPILRWYAYRDLVREVVPAPPKAAPSPEKKARLLRDRDLAAGRIWQMPPLPGGALFVTRVEDFNQYIGGFATCSYLDAIWALARQMIPARRIEIDAGESPPRPEGRRYFPGRYLSTYPFVRARLSGAVTPIASLEGADEVRRGFEWLFGRTFDYFPYENVIREYLGYYDFFEKLLAWVRPGSAFAVSPFDLRSGALAAAARRTGTVSVTIQYGVKSTLFFRRWGRQPETGYDVLADVLWARDEGMADLVRAWECPAHQVEVGGHPWLDWIGSPEAPRLPERDRLLHLVPPGGRIVLISTQGNRLPKIVVEAMARMRGRALFLIRLHPVIVRLRCLNDWRVGPEEEDLMTRRGALLGLESEGPVSEDWLRDQDIEGFEMRDACTIPLPALLSLVDHHVTHRSSTATEAAVFGVPTTFIDPIGMTYDDDLVKAGVFAHAETADQLIDRIERTPRCEWTPENRPREMIHKDLDTARTALQAIFDRARARSANFLNEPTKIASKR